MEESIKLIKCKMKFFMAFFFVPTLYFLFSGSQNLQNNGHFAWIPAVLSIFDMVFSIFIVYDSVKLALLSVQDRLPEGIIHEDLFWYFKRFQVLMGCLLLMILSSSWPLLKEPFLTMGKSSLDISLIVYTAFLMTKISLAGSWRKDASLLFLTIKTLEDNENS